MKKILLIDDDQFLLQVNSQILRLHGYRVITSDTAVGILDMVAAELPDAIVIDYVMPGMNGAEAIKELKQHPTFKAIPVVLFSSKHDIYTVAAGCGANACLIKSDYKSSLVTLLEQLTAS